MAQRLSVLYNKKPCYDIVFQQSFDGLWEELAELGAADKRLCIVTDSTVDGLYAAQILKFLEGKCRKAVKYVFPAGEEHKNLDTVRDVYRFLIEEGFDRKDMLLALGGGVCGDLTGFVAATYLRGIDFVQIPTTLLAQVDSSIGGKTGVDFDSYKNMVGAFKMPRLVYMNLSVLKTLEERQFYSGFAEVMKSALIKDAPFYEWLIENMYEICERDLNTLEEMVIRTCSIKKMVVEKDPTEQGDRALLNLGHTIGHAIEKYKNFELYHGECVALGTVAAAYISWKKEMLSMEEFYEIRDMFVPFYLPISVDDIDPQEILKLTKSDKKMEAGTIKFILLKKIGKAVIDRTVTDEEILAVLKKYGISGQEVTLWGTGKPLREFLWSEEMADASVYIMEHVDFKDTYTPGSKDIRNCHINIGTGKEITIAQLADKIVKEVGYQGKLTFDATKPDGTMRKLTDVSKLHSLGWQHKIDIEEGVHRMYQWYLS